MVFTHDLPLDTNHMLSSVQTQVSCVGMTKGAESGESHSELVMGTLWALDMNPVLRMSSLRAGLAFLTPLGLCLT